MAPRFSRIVLAALAAALVAAAFAAPVASAARLELPVIVVDLAHGQQANGVCAMMSVVPDAYWVIVVPNLDVLGDYKDCILNKAFKVVQGDLTAISKLPSVDMVIIGQPVEPLSDAEKEAILNWVKSPGHKALWCATDSDYPAQGGNLETAQTVCNDLLDYLYSNGIPVHLRSDYVSVEDPTSNAGRSYRVVALVKPPARYDADLIALGAEKVLMHGPGAVAWVDDQGNWHKVTDPGTPDNIIPILVTTENARIVEHQPKAPGEPGQFGMAHSVGETGSFVLLAAEVANMTSERGSYRVVFIVSGESPYYGYQSLVTYQYHGVMLDGPRFFRNLVLWATSMYNELKAYKMIMAQQANIAKKAEEAYMKAEDAVKKATDAAKAASTASTKAEEAAKKADEAYAKAEQAVKKADEAYMKAEDAAKKAGEAYTKAEDASKKAAQAANEINNIKASIEALQKQVTDAANKAGSAYGYAIGAIILAIIAIIAAGLAIQRRG